MLGRAWLVVLICVSMPFVGCLSKGNAGNGTPVTTAANNTLDANATVAPDGRGSISAFNETNKTETVGIGAMMHTHDYWAGKEKIDVGYIPVGLIPFPAAPCKRAAGDCTTGSTTPSTDGSGDTYPVGTAIADFLMTPMQQGGMIYEGTKTIEFTMKDFETTDVKGNVVPPNPAGQVFLDYLAANDEPGHFKQAGELKPGVPLKIDIKPTDADMPHQTKSLWIYRIYSNSQMGSFQCNITITIDKGYAVVNWPPHPDLYADHPTRDVFTGPVDLTSKGTIDGNVWGSDAGWVHPQKVVSWGTDKLDVEITGVTFSSSVPNANPTGWVFEFNNASKPPLLGNGAQYSGRLVDKASDGKTFHFQIDLTKDNGQAYDTPYGQYSRWGFRLVPQFDQGQNACVDDPFAQQILLGCQFVPWEAKYTMKITASGHSIAMGFEPGQAGANAPTPPSP